MFGSRSARDGLLYWAEGHIVRNRFRHGCPIGLLYKCAKMELFVIDTTLRS